MSKFRIEIQIALIALIIGAAVVTTGYFAYKSLSKIVFTIHQETKPDNRLFLMKDISNDLASLENNVRLYTLTGNQSDLKLYDTIQNKVIQNISDLSDLSIADPDDKILTDSIVKLSTEKLELWHDILNLHLSAKVMTPNFTELYSRVEQKIDTITTKTEKKGLLRRIFGTEKVIIDTTIVKQPLERDSIRHEIQNLESKMVEEDEKINVKESQLIEKNITITQKIHQFISEAENRENASLIAKTKEADQMAEITYKRLAIFSVAAVILLLLALFVFFNYQRKTRNYQKVLQKAKTEAENLAKAKEQFASNVSHEMRTPVNAIYGLAEQLLQKKPEDQTKEQISVIAQSASHLRNIINDTLDFSKIQSNKLKMDSIHFSPDKVFSEVINLEQNEAIKKGIDLNFEVDGELPEALLGDPMRLKQILLNLIGNSIKFTDEGTVTLRVKSIKKKYLTHHLEMTVSDSGIGIPTEHHKNIFDEFVQLENQSGKKFSGTGLGLSIVKKLVELQKGSIDVKSEEGKGTEIKITIPFFEGKKENIEELKFDSVVIPETFKNLKVLIADDEEFNLFLMRSILKKWGVYYEQAMDGNKAVEAAIRENFDFILMDIRMPGKSGIEATKDILSHKPNTNIIAVTATKEEIDKEKCIAAGMKGFLLKPFAEKELVDAINSILKSEHIPEIIPDNQKINLEKAKQFANGDETFFKEMILLFIQSTENGIVKINKAVAENNLQEISEAAHKMAAPCKHIHADYLYSKLKQLERQTSDKTNIELVPELISEISYEITRLNTELKTIV